jgi:hypothetical protein
VVTDPWEWGHGALLDDPEPVDNPLGLDPFIAGIRNAILEHRETDRITYCADHGLDPATFRGCHGCGGTGWHWGNNLPCWCEQGKAALAFIARRENELTARVRELVAREKAAT